MANEIIAGLDIGTAKVSVIIGEWDGTELNVLGIGTSHSEGLRRGMIVNMDKTVQSIAEAAEAAEIAAGVEIDSVYASVAGEHIQSVNSRGAIDRPRGDRGISKKDISRAFEAAKDVQIPMDRQVIHLLPQEFIVDDQRGIADPKGMHGVRLEVLVHIVTGAIPSVQNQYKCIKRAGLGVREMVLDAYGSSFAVLTNDEKELGVVLLDVGGGTTDMALFFEGSIRHSAVIPLGGRNITSDIAIGLRTPLEQAEEIKRQHCSAVNRSSEDDSLIEVPADGGRSTRKVSSEQLSSIAGPRMEEIISLANREVKKSGYYDLLGAGVVITGGGALMPGTVDLAEQVFGMPARIGKPRRVSGLVESDTAPMHATGIGLIMYGMESRDHKEWNGYLENSLICRMAGRMKQWFADLLRRTWTQSGSVPCSITVAQNRRF